MVYVAVIVAALILFLIAAVAVGWGDTLAETPPDGWRTVLPDHRLSGEEVAALRLPLVIRGYRMADVDAVLDRLAGELRVRDAEIAELLARQSADG